ncbi:MAG: hypothetical protein MSG64_16835 [Pyrinomonadaceae bacterium MAG19_C2-C3]|nr:hypothetical protein [Pyrinomonadaceae bacterium MAG19_C2-C3]
MKPQSTFDQTLCGRDAKNIAVGYYHPTMDNELIFVIVIVGFFFIIGLVVFGLFVRVWRKEQQAEKTMIEKTEINEDCAN